MGYITNMADVPTVLNIASADKR